MGCANEATTTPNAWVHRAILAQSLTSWGQVVPEIGDSRTWTFLTKPLLPRGVQLPAAIEEGQWMRLGTGTIRPRLGYRLPRAGRRQVFREAWACCCRHFGRGPS